LESKEGGTVGARCEGVLQKAKSNKRKRRYTVLGRKNGPKSEKTLIFLQRQRGSRATDAGEKGLTRGLKQREGKTKRSKGGEKREGMNISELLGNMKDCEKKLKIEDNRETPRMRTESTWKKATSEIPQSIEGRKNRKNRGKGERPEGRVGKVFKKTKLLKGGRLYEKRGETKPLTNKGTRRGGKKRKKGGKDRVG